MEIRRASKKAGVHRKKQKLLSDTRKTRSSLGKVGGIEGNTRKSWRNTRKKGRTIILEDDMSCINNTEQLLSLSDQLIKNNVNDITNMLK